MYACDVFDLLISCIRAELVAAIGAGLMSDMRLSTLLQSFHLTCWTKLVMGVLSSYIDAGAHATSRERERDIQPYVHSASVAYEDKSLFMSAN